MLVLVIRSFEYLDNDSYINLYKAIVRLQLQYGNAVWLPYLRNDYESIEVNQKIYYAQ